jgi:hypothetical protein
VVLSVFLKVLQPQFSKDLNWRFFDSENHKKTWNQRFYYSEKIPKNEEN